VQRALRLADDVEYGGGEKEGVDLVQNGRDRFLAVVVAPTIELALEEGARQGIGDTRKEARPKGSVGQKPR
jgi:hypothetical protein